MKHVAWYSQTWNWFNGAWHEGNPPIIGPRSHVSWLGSSVFDGAKIFKTSPSTYRFALSKLLLGIHEVVFVSSNRWDVAGATAFGMASVWVNRQGLPDEYAELAPRAIVSSLDTLF